MMPTPPVGQHAHNVMGRANLTHERFTGLRPSVSVEGTASSLEGGEPGAEKYLALVGHLSWKISLSYPSYATIVVNSYGETGFIVIVNHCHDG